LFETRLSNFKFILFMNNSQLVGLLKIKCVIYNGKSINGQ
jgi:hypothetical protein